MQVTKSSSVETNNGDWSRLRIWDRLGIRNESFLVLHGSGAGVGLGGLAAVFRAMVFATTEQAKVEVKTPLALFGRQLAVSSQLIVEGAGSSGATGGTG